MERPDEPWQHKSFQELWEGNIDYQEQSSVSEILSAICEAYNSSPPVNKPHTSPLTNNNNNNSNNNNNVNNNY